MNNPYRRKLSIEYPTNTIYLDEAWFLSLSPLTQEFFIKWSEIMLERRDRNYKTADKIALDFVISKGYSVSTYTEEILPLILQR